jgi:hypothetical protein
MNMNGPDNDELTRIVKETLSGEVSEAQERHMREMLSEFRGKLDSHPYVRKLEKRHGSLSLNLRRWTLIVAGLLGFMLLVNASDNARQTRIAAAVSGKAVPEMALSAAISGNNKDLNREIDRVLTQACLTEDRGDTDGGSL